MEHTPKICPKCRQANFPIAEFCRHCGEPIFEMGSLSKTSLISRWLGHLVDGAFWIVDEFVRWWEITKVSSAAKKLKRERSTIVTDEPSSTPPDQREKLVNISEEISRLSNREEFLRRHTWGMTPEIVFGIILVLFVSGIIWLRPKTAGAPVSVLSFPVDFSGALQPTKDLPPFGHSVVTSAAWFSGKLYVGGDAGLLAMDPVTGVASAVTGLPADFFVRHLVREEGKLLIAGYGGIFALDATGIAPFYEPGNLPYNLINRIALSQDGHYIGTVGSGLLKGKKGLAVVLLGTSGLTINGFSWLDGELWLLHERGLMRGDGTNFTPVQIPVLEGKKLKAIAADASVLYVGTSDGLVAAYKSNQNWVWTPIMDSPKNINDLMIASSTLLVCADDGFFRLQGNRFEKISPKARQQVMTAEGGFLATIGVENGTIYRFTAAGPLPTTTSAPIVPTIGSFVETPGPQPTSAVSPSPPRAVSPATPMTGAPVQSFPVPTPAPTFSQIPVAVSNNVILETTLPPGLAGPGVTSAKWDGIRLWVGTSNSGLWKLEGGAWKNFSKATGELPDNQITSFWTLQGKVFLFGFANGLLSLESGRPVPVLAPEKSLGFIAIGGDPSAPLTLFDKGRIFRIRSNALEPAGQLPPDYRNNARGIFQLDGLPVIVTDQGFSFLQQNGEWGVTLYPERSEGKALQSILGDGGIIYVGKSDGSVFSFQKGKAAKVGSIGERVTGLSFDGTLFVSGSRNVFRLTGTALSPLPSQSPDNILNLQSISMRKAILLATTTGLNSLPFPQ